MAKIPSYMYIITQVCAVDCFVSTAVRALYCMQYAHARSAEFAPEVSLMNDILASKERHAATGCSLAWNLKMGAHMAVFCHVLNFMLTS